MGKNNRQRRAAKARRRANTQRATRVIETDRPNCSSGHSVPSWRESFIAAARAIRDGDAASARGAVEVLATGPHEEVAAAVAEVLEQQLAHLWEHGWQPIDVDRVIARELGDGEVRVVRHAITADARRYADLGTTVAPGWMSQVETVGAQCSLVTDRPYLLWRSDAWHHTLLCAIRVLNVLLVLPRLPRLVDPPSAWREGSVLRTDSVPEGLLDKVRALLAKAESTTFEAEADAFTAKAQELMTRHRIDRAMIDTGVRDQGDGPIGRRIAMDDPYAEAKAALVNGIARANGCRAVWSKELGFTTVFGFVDELAGVEELFTSLLLQATSALRREGSKLDHWGRSRTTRFRRSFLVAFAIRISRRLQETADAAADAVLAEHDAADLLPILAARDGATQAAADEAFPNLTAVTPSLTDREGWYAGTLFGDKANLALGPELVRTPP